LPDDVPIAPEDLDSERLFGGVHWHQRWQVFRDVYTPGINAIDALCVALQLPRDLAGQRVLDLGAWNGCLSLECERRGADEVVALSIEDPSDTGFLRLQQAIGSTRTRYRSGSVYDLNPDDLGAFDVVLFCGVLYHLRYPLLALDNIRRVCRGVAFVESFVSDASFMAGTAGLNDGLRRRLLAPLDAVPLWQFFQGDELHQDTSNWFGPNAAAVVQAFDSAGFETRFLTRYGPNRATFHARVKPGLPEFLGLGCAEATYYDTNVAHLFRGPRLDRDGSIEQLLDEQFGATVAVRGRIVAAYYRTFLDRSPSDAETDHWVRQMSRGASHESVITAFLCSDEYWVNCRRESVRWRARVHADLLGHAEGVPLSVSTRPVVVADLVRRRECYQHLEKTIYGPCLALDTATSVRPN
jgi:tRNA (mo5U34)-methyltransferase